MTQAETTRDWREWVGRERVEEDELALAPARGMAGLLDRDPERLHRGSRLPSCWHWLYFWPVMPQSQLAPDGHARRGGFLPPVPLPRRMWVGGRLRFLQPLFLGDPVQRQSTIQSISEKQGRSGRLAFVTVRHLITGPRGPATEEEQDLVYRDPARVGETRPVGDPLPTDLQWTEALTPDPVLLFRFSALTFNGHRIHYDHPYVTGVEGYPGLVVHGPLTALLLLDAAERHRGSEAVRYTYRAVAPLFSGEAITIGGRATADPEKTEVWAAGPGGRTAMHGAVECAPSKA